MVRVARLKRLILAGDLSVGPDGWTHAETLSAISKRVHELAEEQHLCFSTPLCRNCRPKRFIWFGRKR